MRTQGGERDEPLATVICPALDEAATIDELCTRILDLDLPLELLVVDDGSADDTATLARASGARVIAHDRTRGNGAAIKTGIEHARGKLIVIIDGDGQHDPSAIPRLLRRFDEGADLVVGCRTNFRGSGRLRALGNRVLNMFASLLTGTRIPDLTCGFRAFRREHILPLLPVLPDGYSTPTTSTLEFLRRGLCVVFEPAPPATPARARKTKTRLVRDGLRFLTIVARVASRSRPMTTNMRIRGEVGALAFRTLPVLVISALLLTGLELEWLSERSVDLTPMRVAIVAASITTAVGGIGLTLLGCLALGARAVPRFASAALVLVGIFPAYLVAQSLFSGGFVRDIPSIGWIKTGVTLALVAGIPLAVWLFGSLSRARGRAARLAIAAAALVAAAALGYLDTHVQVGLYPAAHYLLAAAVVYCSALSVTLLLPRSVPRLATGAAAAALVGAVAFTAWSWATPDALSVAVYSDGLMPKLRGGAVGIARSATTLVAGEPVAPALELSPDEFRFKPTQAAELDAIRSRVKNVVFVLVDALRNDHVGKVRDGHSLTPFLDELGRRSIRYASTYAGSDRTGQSMPVLMTSFPLGVVDRAAELDMPLVTWMDTLRERGLETFANGNCDYLARKFPHVPITPCYGAESIGTDANDLDGMVPEIVKFVEERGDRPFAVYTHWMDAHILESVHDPRAEYAAAVQRIDARMRNLVEGIDRSGHANDTLIILTADHGYGLGEGNRFLANQCCSELQIRVPLLVVLPGSTHSGRVVEQNVSAIDVLPTVLDVLAPDALATVGGRSLLGLLYDANDPRLSNDHTVYTLGIRVHMVRQGDMKLHWNEWRDTKLVVNVGEDPEELHPVVLGEPRDRLWRSLQTEVDRQARLAAALTAGDRDIDSDVVIALLRAGADEHSLARFLETFWERNTDTQRALLQAIVRHRVASLAGDLEALDRPEQWTPIDQLLLVTQSFVGVDGACTTLAARVDGMAVEPRTWLAELYPELSSRCRSLVSKPLLAAIYDVRSQSPGLEDPEGHFLALASAMLSRVSREETPRDVKELLRDLCNVAAEHPTRYRIPSLRSRMPFDRRLLLDGLEPSIGADDLDILATLVVDKYSAPTITRLGLRFDTLESRELLIQTAHGPLDAEAAQSIVATIRETDGDEGVRTAVSTTLASRFPKLDTSI
ncbi:MAG TPA: glycosyltransferase [Gammaproteobacteria bacterium]|nr:glycosyltransferase [Gammaproteobacteria bacterium]